MFSLDESTTESGTQRAAIEYPLPAGRFEWVFEGWFKPVSLSLAPKQSLQLLSFRNEGNTSVAARVYNDNGLLVAGLRAKNPDGTYTQSNSKVTVSIGAWRKWRLHVLRVGTSDTTAVLSLDGAEQLRLNWDSSGFKPDRVRAGIVQTSAHAKATVLTDDLHLAEQ